VDGKKKTLFCPGIPGAGKTILASVVVNDLHTRFRNDERIGIAYIYCNFRRQDEQKAQHLLANLLKQLVQGQKFVPDSVKSLYDHHNNGKTQPSIDELSRTLQSVATLYSRVFLVVDALDKCQVFGGCRSKFLSEIFTLQAKCRASFFTTLRDIPQIINKLKVFKESISLEIRATELDVRRYVDGHMAHLPSFVQTNPELQEQVRTGIIRAADGMFLLAHLHLDSLNGKKSPKAVRVALAKLPTGSDAYNRAYNDAMERIEGQVRDQIDLAKQVLSWITCSRRPLTTTELQYALAVEVGESELDKENLSQIEDVISVCAGLVTVDAESHIIRLVHFTTQEYFERTQAQWFPRAERDITEICVTYLSFSCFESGPCGSDDEFERRLQGNPLYKYAAQNWGHHARQASGSSPKIIRFLQGNTLVEASSQALHANKRWTRHSNYSQEFPKLMTGFHLAAYFGVVEVVAELVRNGIKIDAKDEEGQTPLIYAAMNGHDAMVQRLLATGQVNADLKDIYGNTPLIYAASNGHDAIVERLLATGQVNADLKDLFGQTPLSHAAMNGYNAIAERLLATGQVNADLKDIYGQTPLIHAAGRGHDAVVQHLLATGQVNAKFKDDFGQTPLFYATRNGHDTVSRQLQAWSQE
jgi:hypothetical protein